MTITELIGQLLAALVKCGDIVVDIHDPEYNCLMSVGRVVVFEETADLSARVEIR